MGERYTLNINCVYCGEKNEDVWYAPTCNFYTFKCKKCEKHNFITSDFYPKKVENVTEQEVYNAFVMATSVGWDDEERFRKCRMEETKEIRKLNWED